MTISVFSDVVDVPMLPLIWAIVIAASDDNDDVVALCRLPTLGIPSFSNLDVLMQSNQDLELDDCKRRRTTSITRCDDVDILFVIGCNNFIPFVFACQVCGRIYEGTVQAANDCYHWNLFFVARSTG